MNLQNRKRLTDRKHTYSCQREGIVRDFGKVKYTLLYLITNEDLCIAHGTLLKVMCPALMGGALGEGGYMYIYG